MHEESLAYARKKSLLDSLKNFRRDWWICAKKLTIRDAHCELNQASDERNPKLTMPTSHVNM